MEDYNIVTPPETEPTGKRGGFWKQIGMLVLGTTVSLVLTFGSAHFFERQQRAQDRRLTALMVMSNIDKFAQQLDKVADEAASADTAIVWLYSIPKDSLDIIDGGKMSSVIKKALRISVITSDKSAESIFSNSIETWKNMGNFHFIDNVGECFSIMRFCEEHWNNSVGEMQSTCAEIRTHPDNYAGATINSKIVQAPNMRQKFLYVHSLRSWAKHNAALLRYMNKKNMAVIGITEQEMKDFIASKQTEIKIDEAEPNYSDFKIPKINPDSLTIF
jgi:hypothetical protein